VVSEFFSMTTDILILGGGVIGLAIALELRLNGASVTILSRDFAEAAAHAAAGMLASQAEQIPPSPLLDLCLRSRDLYPAWICKLEELTGLDAGYWACGILAPEYSPASSASPYWLDHATIHQHQPGLCSEVVGGYWYPQDAQVDSRALAKALWTAVQDLGVVVKEGITVQHICHQAHQVRAVQTSAGEFQAGHYILATGAWSQALLSIPVYPKKGQMLSVRVPGATDDFTTLPLQTVLFGSEIYIVPRKDGRIVLGATSEDVGFMPSNTPRGIDSLLRAAMRLYPDLQHFPIQELWWGFRPTTPDELPILGASPYSNLTLATGHHRNGILLAPVTAQLVANFVLHPSSDPLLEPFRWSRFMAQQH
jgi:glycine oxidase